MSKKKIISCFIGAIALGGVALCAGITSASTNDGKFHIDYTKKDVNAPLGTKDNVFTVVEIVPCESMAQIGYLIPGCEPIDMKALASCNDVDFPQDYENNLLLSNNGELANREKKSQRRFTDALTVDDVVDSWIPENELLLADGLKDAINNADPAEITKQYGVWKLKKDGAYSEYGYYLRVEDGTGEFAMTEDADGKKTFSPTAANDGNFAWFGNGYYSTEKDADGNPIYIPFHDAEAEPEGRPIDYGETAAVGDKFWTNRADRYSYECLEQTITTTDAFIQQVFPGCSTAAGFQSQVLVVTPTQLNNMSEEEMKDLLGTAELIEFHTGTQGGMEDTWIKFNKENKQLTEEELKRRTFAQNDINWEVTWTLVERMASNRPAAMIFEGPNMYNSMTGNVLPDSNVRKLYIMLMQYGAKAFYNQFGNQIGVTTSKSGKDAMTGEALTTGVYMDYYKGHSATPGTNEVIWDDMTFYINGIPEEESASLMHAKRLDASGVETFETIYSYNGDTSLFMAFMDKKPLNTTNNGATNSDAYEYFWDKDGEGSHADGLDGIDYMEYILHGFRAGMGEKSHLNILEVQPCNTFIYKDSPTWKLYYMKLLPWFNGAGANLEEDLTVTTMTTWEFIGSLEDLNAKYDLIIFGDNQNAANGVAQANPDGSHVFNYNDSRYITYGWPEYALAYTSFGDLVQASNQTMRYSGNDITERKFLELKSYLAGNQAIVVDGGLYNGTSSVNEKIVDKSSVFYKFATLGANTTLEGGLGKNIFITTANRQNAMKKYVAYETCDLEFYTEDGSNGYPPEYDYTENSDGTIASNSVSYVQGGKISYRFKINGLEDLNYGVGLYVDRSSDGVYAGSLLEEVVGNTYLSEGMGITVTQNGNMVPNGSLKPGVWYMAECKLPSSYIGVLPWKLEAYCSGNTNIRDSEMKCASVRSRYAPRVEVKVLEMALTPNMSDAGDYYDDVLYMATTGKHTNEQLQKYLDCVDEYDVTVEFLDNTEWMEMFVNNPDYATREEKIEAWKEYLDDYDLLSIGYTDGLTFAGDGPTMGIYKEGFEYFREIGKGILISHDIVQTIDTDANNAAWLRDLVGQQRYTSNVGQIKGSVTIPVPFQSADNGIKLFCEYGDPAHSDHVMNDEAIAEMKAGNTAATYLNLVNAGQITQYPYKIDSLIEINPTHVQMNQLDLETEGMSVWATMTDRYTKDYQDYLSDDMETQPYFGTGTGLYSSRESDVRNSYYLYNVGNITYTGVGHTGGDLTTDEMKLYVNTLLAAYRPSPDKPYIEVTNEDKVESATETSFYIPFDGEEILNTSEDSVEKFRVHFTVVDTSALTNRTYSLNFCDAEGNPLANQYALFTENGGSVARDAKGWQVVKGGNYYYDVPYSLIRQGKNIDYLNLESEYLNPANVVVKTSEISAISEMKTPLFNLR